MGQGRRSVPEELPPQLITQRVLAVSSEVRAREAALVTPVSALAPTLVRGVCCADGSAPHSSDPGLRTAAWAAMWFADGQWCSAFRGVPGRQTVGRAELMAAVWVYEHCPEPEALYVDNVYVVSGVVAVLAARKSMS